MEKTKPPSEARRRILETADRLFYREGIRVVGVDRVVAEAGVAKMTLYAHFPSKDDLILAVLQFREQRMVELFRAGMAKHAEQAPNKLQSFFLALEDLVSAPEFRGCPFQNAAAELVDPAHPGFQFVREQKQRFSSLIHALAEESAPKPPSATLSAAIALLIEGAIVSAVIQRSPDSVRVAAQTAGVLLGLS